MGDARQVFKGEPDCKSCLGNGFIPATTRNVRICDCIRMTIKDDIEMICKQITKKMWRLNPDFKKPIMAALDERHWSYRQFVGSCMFYVLERNLQMSMPQHPFFAEGAPDVPEEARCKYDQCRQTFKPKFRGDAFCCIEHGQLALPKRKVVPPPEPVAEPAEASSEVAEHESALPTYGEHDELADA